MQRSLPVPLLTKRATGKGDHEAGYEETDHEEEGEAERFWV
ncbi:MAG: hypothetical protein WD490_07875 [Opitutales bacterium]